MSTIHQLSSDESFRMCATKNKQKTLLRLGASNSLICNCTEGSFCTFSLISRVRRFQACGDLSPEPVNNIWECHLFFITTIWALSLRTSVKKKTALASVIKSLTAPISMAYFLSREWACTYHWCLITAYESEARYWCAFSKRLR